MKSSFIIGLFVLLITVACSDRDRLIEAGWNQPTNNPIIKDDFIDLMLSKV